MKIEGLTPEQRQLCDILWSLSSTDEYRELLSVLDDRQRQMAETLVQIMIHENIEETVMQTHIDRDFYPDAMRAINKIMKEGRK